MEKPGDTGSLGSDAVLGSMPSPSRARRLFSGWSASLFQIVLGVTQQVALIPVFLHFWSGEILAAWLASTPSAISS